MADIDLLVYRKDVVKIGNILEALGFLPLAGNSREIAVPRNNEIHFVNKNIRLGIDVHFNIESEFHPVKNLIDELWQDAVAIKIANVDTSTLSLEDHFIHLSTHYTNHHLFDQLKRLVDIHILLERKSAEIDWNKLFAKAEKYGVVNSIVLSLNILKDLTLTTIPQVVKDSPHFCLDEHLIKRVKHYLLLGESYRALHLRVAIVLMLQKGWRNKVNYLRNSNRTAVEIAKLKTSNPLLLFLRRIQSLSNRVYLLLRVAFSMGLNALSIYHIASWLHRK